MLSPDVRLLTRIAWYLVWSGVFDRMLVYAYDLLLCVMPLLFALRRSAEPSGLLIIL